MSRIKELLRQLRILFFLGRGLTRVPTERSLCISDLFPIRRGDDWETYFELIDVNNLTKGMSTGVAKPVSFYFHDNQGNFLGKESIMVGSKSRMTIDLAAEFPQYKEAASFSVFHQALDDERFGSSFLAERGYTGYEYKKLGVRGYVHGNLDSIALNSDSELQPLGKRSALNRRYLVQHVLSGPAQYEFALTNPTPRTVTVRFELKVNGDWKESERVKIPSKGLHIFQTNLGAGHSSLLRVVSKLSMGRPVVFRLTQESMDVFHG